ncbi:LacI family transcriptional regulator [Enterovibrio norvegicus FF-33]|uniref:LacI family transcriptional regulator n=1 Tax=Enterovibrio norvegicus FF-454 TaxID=1185651 RepID=A0A1E5C151_9GAMM|nr:LacI family DNA-binding transcriptional regulator [Enterovibrio norvegicus]OEE59230.1 LacI family transcriptional regulator [Enterovibrio norvegicus FF-454]OEE67599.1 LacI family transcriptional regulator [Enterovibrio norvegicus FF-33]
MKKETKRTTIYDLATRIGASPSSVSSVLNGTWKKRRISAKLAERVLQLAKEEGYAVNAQASLLRRERSNIVGMIVPKYDNRYFGDIAEKFESMARLRGLIPVVTCTQRSPDLEFDAARELVSYQAECLISTGATDPDRISDFCHAAGVQSINMDLPGSKTASVISDNYAGAFELTQLILDRCERELGWVGPLRFVGGRLTDHNTAARLQGFLAAQRERGIAVPDDYVMAEGYSAKKAEQLLANFQPTGATGLFVNSTISLEGVVSWQSGLPDGGAMIRYGCFDWDPFGSFLPGNVGMVEQDVETMLANVFNLVGKTESTTELIKVPCKLRVFGP